MNTVSAADLGLPNLNRRRLLAAVPVFAAAAALPAIALGAGEDPAITAINAWVAEYARAWGAAGVCCRLRENSEEWQEAFDSCDRAMTIACETQASTIASLALQVRLAFAVFGQPMGEAPILDPDSYEFGEWTNGRDEALIRNMLAAAERLAREAVA